MRLSGASNVATGRTIDLRQQGTTNKFNWRIGAQANINNGFEITPSTAADGTSFTTPAFAVLSSGNVGIGTIAPTAKLHVAGDIKVDGNIAAKFQDVAEWVDAGGKLPAGTVVVAGAKRNFVAESQTSYDTAVLGVVSAEPGIVLGEEGPDRVLVAQSGRVRTKVDATYGAIKRGDLLVTSPHAGYAMKSQPVTVSGVELHRPGTIVGKALEDLDAGTGEVLVLLTLQ
jgi:hypothetical protein